MWRSGGRWDYGPGPSTVAQCVPRSVTWLSPECQRHSWNTHCQKLAERPQWLPALGREATAWGRLDGGPGAASTWKNSKQKAKPNPGGGAQMVPHRALKMLVGYPHHCSPVWPAQGTGGWRTEGGRRLSWWGLQLRLFCQMWSPLQQLDTAPTGHTATHLAHALVQPVPKGRHPPSPSCLGVHCRLALCPRSSRPVASLPHEQCRRPPCWWHREQEPAGLWSPWGGLACGVGDSLTRTGPTSGGVQVRGVDVPRHPRRGEGGALPWPSCKLPASLHFQVTRPPLGVTLGCYSGNMMLPLDWARAAEGSAAGAGHWPLDPVEPGLPCRCGHCWHLGRR